VQQHDDPAAMTDDRVRELMYELGGDRPGFTLNPMKGTAGDFYRDNRAQDIHDLCQEIIVERHRRATDDENDDEL
jgi:hypothetical protein